jgi:universal stress protein E
MNAIHRILFAVKDPSARRNAGIDKAIDIARRLGASLELFHAISTPVFADLQPLTGTSLSKLKREALKLQLGQLEAHAERAGTPDVRVTCKVLWDYPPHEAIVRRARRSGADLIIAECHAGSRLKPWLMHLTDWELLRSSHAPVLLFKNTTRYRRPAVLAAVDPTHVHAKPAQLDSEIVTIGKMVAESLAGSLHAMHANHPAVFGLTLGDPSFDANTLAATFEQQKRKDSADFKAFAEKSGIPRARRHEVHLDPVYGIPKVARSMHAQLVVMGAMSRSGLKRVFIGNTSERVLPDLPCDVLVVKPPYFKARVDQRPRGIRVMAPTQLMPLPV